MIDLWKQIENDELKIYQYGKKISFKNQDEILDNIYSYIKKRSINYYNGEYMHPGYNLLKDAILLTEKKVIGKILDNDVYISLNEKTNNFIEYLVLEGRKYLLQKCSNISQNIDILNLNNYNFTNFCMICSKYIKKICDQNKIINYIVPIYPGYTDKYNLYNGYGYHFFNIVYNNNKYYLIDLTYSQFFTKEKNNLERIGLVDISGVKAGRFMLLNELNKNIALDLIKNGYIELDEIKFKIYLDAFTLSFRNGIYYENTNDFSFITNYTIDDYINFLTGNDNQINHEGLENLGYQKRPLKKYFAMNKN